jgi:hypothetical protein
MVVAGAFTAEAVFTAEWVGSTVEWVEWAASMEADSEEVGSAGASVQDFTVGSEDSVAAFVEMVLFSAFPATGRITADGVTPTTPIIPIRTQRIHTHMCIRKRTYQAADPARLPLVRK